MAVVQHVRDADVLIVFDAVDYGLPPGTIRRVEDDEVPQFMGCKKISLHQTGFQEEVLAMAEMMGDAPGRLLLIGVQPEELDDYGGSLRDCVRAQIEPAIAMAIEELRALGIEPRRRGDPRLLADANFSPPEDPDAELEAILADPGRGGA